MSANGERENFLLYSLSNTSCLKIRGFVTDSQHDHDAGDGDGSIGFPNVQLAIAQIEEHQLEKKRGFVVKNQRQEEIRFPHLIHAHGHGRGTEKTE